MIKRGLLLTPVALLPYGVIFMGYLFFCHSEIIENVFHGNPIPFFAVLLSMILFAVTVTSIAFILSLINKWECTSLARSVMIVKLIHIPAYILIFFCGLFFGVTVFLFAANIFLVIFDCIFIGMTGMLATSSVVLAVQQKKWASSNTVWPILLQFIFCIDVVASIVFYIKLRKSAKQAEVQDVPQYATY